MSRPPSQADEAIARALGLPRDGRCEATVAGGQRCSRPATGHRHYWRLCTEHRQQTEADTLEMMPGGVIRWAPDEAETSG